MNDNSEAPSKVEKLPDLADYLGLHDDAEMDANRIRQMALSLRNLQKIQEDERLEDSDPVPGINPEARTFAEQRQVINEAYQRRVKACKDGDYWALVQARLQEMKR